MCFLPFYWSSKGHFNKRGNNVSVNQQPSENELKFMCTGTQAHARTHTNIHRGCNAATLSLSLIFMRPLGEASRIPTGQINILMSTKPLCNEFRYKCKHTFIKAFDIILV